MSLASSMTTDTTIDPPSRRTLLDRIPPSLRTPPVIILASLVVLLLIAVVALAVSRPAGEDPAASACRAFATDSWESYEFLGDLKGRLAASRNEKLRLAGKMWGN